MFVTTLPLLAAVLQPAHDTIDRVWMPLVRSHHEHGSWVARIDDKLISGDWKITSAAKSYNPLAHQATQETWVHYVDSLGVGYCAVSLENPKTMYCQLARCDQMWKCSATQGPTFIHEKVKPTEPQLAQELRLFQLINKVSLGDHLGVAIPKLKTPTLTIRLPYRIEVTGTRVHWSDKTETGYDRDLMGYEAAIVFGPRASDVAITRATPTGRVTERCSYPAHAATSCSFHQPTCELR